VGPTARVAPMNAEAVLKLPALLAEGKIREIANGVSATQTGVGGRFPGLGFKPLFRLERPHLPLRLVGREVCATAPLLRGMNEGTRFSRERNFGS
jgi:hypothetical protein